MMVKGRFFILITIGVFSALFLWNSVQNGYFFRETVKKNELEFHLIKDEKPFVVIVPSYNNEEYVEKNLSSILEQEYQNYRVIFIDDSSSDKTIEKALQVIENHSAEDIVTLIRNQENYKALYNLYYTIQALSDDTIVFIVDGDDWLAHPRVLKELNRYYSNPDVWLAYGQYITYPKYEKGKTGPLNAKIRSIRGQHTFPQLRTFYAGLFKKIQLRDLLYQGDFFKTSSDLAVIFPLWEMAREHAVFIPDVLYVYNRESPMNDDKIHRQSQEFFDRYIRALPSYHVIDLFQSESVLNDDVALIVFSEDRPLQLLSFLESLEKQDQVFSPIHIFYTASGEDYKRGYEIVKEIDQKNTVFHEWSGEKEFLEILKGVESNYITFGKDTLVVNHEIPMNKVLSMLEKTGAYGAYFDLGLNISTTPSKVISAGDGFFVFDFSLGREQWRHCNRFDMALYRKNTILSYINKIHFNTILEFEEKWKKCKNLRQIGLFYRQSIAVNIPFQITKVDTNKKTFLYSEEELNDRLLEGYKIDITPIRDLEIRSSEIEFYPHFLMR
jgi:glycosyltransferase involved in cell wall biosynthesis